MQTQTYRVKGMHCASCASIIERTVKKIDGVESIAVNNSTENAKISFDVGKTSPDSFNKKLEPLGDFVKDPDEDISEIKLIDPKDYKKYFDWGEVGDRLMERALEAKTQMDLEMNYIR